MRCYHYRENRNFGDLLAPLLLKHFTRLETEWAPPENAQIVSTGSVLDVMPAGWDGIVAGSGKLHRYTYDMTEATVLGLRGPLTAREVRTRDSNYVLGDPALLASELVKVTPNLFDLGIVPHWNDPTLVKRFSHLADEWKVVFIDPAADPLAVVKLIGSCRKIVSSALHGIIIADAFQIPRRMEMSPALGSRCICGVVHEGDSFKFEDHNAALNIPTEWGKVQVANRERVEAIQHDLFEMFAMVPHVLS